MARLEHKILREPKGTRRRGRPAIKPELSESQDAIRRALEFYEMNKNGIHCEGPMKGQKIDNKRYIVVTDYTLPNTQKRQFIIDLETGDVDASYSAHGYGSSYNCPPEHVITGGETQCAVPSTFTNECKKGTTLTGFFVSTISYQSGESSFNVGKPDDESNHNAVRLEGLQKGVNDTANKCGKVWHAGGYAGNRHSFSAGCPMTEPETFWKFRDKLKGGALFYNHTIQEEKNPSLCPTNPTEPETRQ